MKAFYKRADLHVLLGAGSLVAVFLAGMRAPAADWALNGLTGVAALVGAAIVCTRLALGGPNRMIRGFWLLALVLLLAVGVSEFGGSWAERFETRLGIDDFNDCLVLLAAFVALWFTTKLDQAPVWARRLLWAGFLLHLLATFLDLGDDSRKLNSFDPALVESAADLFQFLALQSYLVGAVMFITVLRLKRFDRGQANSEPGVSAGASRAADPGILVQPNRPEPLGLRARRDFCGYIARGSLRHFTRSGLYVEGARPIMFSIRTAWCLWKFGRVTAAVGRPLTSQAADMLRLGWRDGIDPILYPTLELYRPERRGWADHALSRYEVGNGMLKRLHKLRPKPHGERVNLGDKLAFHRCCRAHRLASPQILIHASGGALNWLETTGMEALDRDLFLKPRQSRGARNSLWLQRSAPFTWRTKSGETWSRDDLFGYLRSESRLRDLLLQGMLLNHPSIANLANESLIAIRVFTSMDANETPVVTHAMLRVISKLEPNWHSKREHAAAIDLESGQLGRMCNDKDLWPGCWSDRHPVTNAPVAGRVLEAWPEIRALALEAQLVFSDRMLVGWDIALTPSGPVILEGNSYPDVHFLQRVHEQPIGLSPLAPMIRRALDAARVRDRHMIEARRV